MEPFVSIRLFDRFHKNPVLGDELLALLDRYPGSCDDVWLTTGLGFPPLAEHEKSAAEMAVLADKVRSHGYAVTLQVANTVGHGDLGKNFSFAMFYKNMVDVDGNEIRYRSCPRDERFLAYTRDVFAIYAKAVRPTLIYPDDDLRLIAGKQGCFCDGCIADFNREYGHSFTREELKKRIFCEDDFTLSEEWRDFCDESLSYVITAVIEGAETGVDKVQIGLQLGNHVNYEKYHRVAETVLNLTGRKPVLRAGGGVYTDATPFAFVEKAKDIQYQNEFLSEYIDSFRPELEGYPHTVFNKSPRGFNTEASVALAFGCNALSYAAVVCQNEPLRKFEPLFASIAAYRPYFERLASLSESTGPGGLQVPVMLQKPVLDSGNRENPGNILMLLRSGVPICHRNRPTGDLIYIDVPTAEVIPESTFTGYLRLNTVIDSDALSVLYARGFGKYLGLSCKVLPNDGFCPENEILTCDPLNDGISGENWFCPVWLWLWDAPHEKYAFAEDDASHPLRVLSRYAETGDAASVLAVSPFGGKIAVFGNVGCTRTPLNSSKTLMINRLVADMTKEGYAYLSDPEPVTLSLRLDENRRLKAVSFFHYGMEFLNNLAFTVKNPAGKQMILHRPECESTVLKEPILPTLAPGGVATVEFV